MFVDDDDDDTDLGDDRLVGVRAIGAFRKEPERRTRHLIARNLIPVGREGRLRIASKKVLRALHRAQTAGGGV
jgi:hypothetical protein